MDLIETDLWGGQTAPSSDAFSPEHTSAPPNATRHRLPRERASLTHKFKVANFEGFITVGLYPDGRPGEIFLRLAKEGSTLSGLMGTIGMLASIALQHGVPLEVLCAKLEHMAFEPSGWTGNEQIGYAKSITDYIFRWLKQRFIDQPRLPFDTAGVGL